MLAAYASSRRAGCSRECARRMNRTPRGCVCTSSWTVAMGQEGIGMSDENPVTALGRDQPPGACSSARARSGATACLAACSERRRGRHRCDPPRSAGASEDPGATEEPGGEPAPLGKVSDIPVGGGTIFAGAQVVVTQPTDGQFKALPVDLHPPGLPDRQRRRRHDQLQLPRQQVLDRRTARSRNGPATRPLTEQRRHRRGRQHRPGLTRSTGGRAASERARRRVRDRPAAAARPASRDPDVPQRLRSPPWRTRRPTAPRRARFPTRRGSTGSATRPAG